MRRQDLRETSLILTFYTKGFGKIKGVVKGARGVRAACGGGAFEIFALDNVVFYERKKSELFTISHCDLLEFFAPVRSSLEKLAYASYFIELADAVTVLHDPHKEVFELLSHSLRLLCGEDSPKRIARIFEIKILGLLGLMPALGRCSHCGKALGARPSLSLLHGGLLCDVCGQSDKTSQPVMAGTVKFIEHVRSSGLEKLMRVKVASEVGRDLERVLRRFLDYHVEHRFNTLRFLKAIEA
ncbi:MAG: DNA repair protein RecO [Candidatus Omnitrophica bacterium]|nr:DNA repair protein RecO [Candidatus Omnitrophota bacterium]